MASAKCRSFRRVNLSSLLFVENRHRFQKYHVSQQNVFDLFRLPNTLGPGQNHHRAAILRTVASESILINEKDLILLKFTENGSLWLAKSWL